jgi:hypothetical protein
LPIVFLWEFEYEFATDVPLFTFLHAIQIDNLKNGSHFRL